MDRAREVGCAGTFQIFTTSPRRWAATDLKEEQAELFRKKTIDYHYVPFAHMPYMPNLASPDDKFYHQSVDVLIREVRRCAKLGIGNLVLHFGSHLGSSIDEGHKRVILACKRAIIETPLEKVRLLLETSAGTRNSIGSRFEYVKKVLDGIGSEQRTGVCFDTCHVFASGYDLRDDNAVKQTFDEFERIIGLSCLYLIHVNDSKGSIGEGKDRHEHIGMGHIGNSGFRALLSYESTRHLPFILETPVDKARDDKQDVAHTKKLAGI